MMNSAEIQTKPVPKSRFQEFATATKLLEEAKLEICKLEKRNNDLADALNELYDWATQAEKRHNESCGELKNTSLETSMKGDISIDVRKSLAEYFCPPSAGETEKLQRENADLKNQINELKSGSDLTKQVVDLNSQVSSLKLENENKEETIIRITKELSDFKQLVNTPDHAKDLEILKLKQILKEKENNRGLEKIRKTLNEEAEILKKRLVETTEMCKKYTSGQARSAHNTPTKASTSADGASNPQAQPAVAMYGETAHVLSNDVAILHEQLKDVLDKNFRWQTYNSSREDYVRNLLQKYNDVSKRLQNSQTDIAQLRSNPDKLATEQRKYFDGLLVQARQELEKTREEASTVNMELNLLKKKMSEEADRYEKDVDYWRDRCEQQQEANIRLTAECENERRRSNNSMNENNHKKTQIQFLQKQVDLYSEDFRAERKEKEELKRELHSLKREFVEVKRKHSFTKKALGNYISYSDHDAIEEKKFLTETVMQEECRTAKENNYLVSSPPKIMRNEEKVTKRPPRRPAPCTPLASRNERRYHANEENTRSKTKSAVEKRTQSHYPFLNQPDDISSSTARSDKTKKSNSRKNHELAKDEIDCPNCGKKYNINQHMLLLKHIDTCE